MLLASAQVYVVQDFVMLLCCSTHLPTCSSVHQYTTVTIPCKVQDHLFFMWLIWFLFCPGSGRLNSIIILVFFFFFITLFIFFFYFFTVGVFLDECSRILLDSKNISSAVTTLLYSMFWKFWATDQLNWITNTNRGFREPSFSIQKCIASTKEDKIYTLF